LELPQGFDANENVWYRPFVGQGKDGVKELWGGCRGGEESQNVVLKYENVNSLQEISESANNETS
jgi:hypothetical protein